jgi:hypothetical protein
MHKCATLLLLALFDYVNIFALTFLQHMSLSTWYFGLALGPEASFPKRQYCRERVRDGQQQSPILARLFQSNRYCTAQPVATHLRVDAKIYLPHFGNPLIEAPVDQCCPRDRYPNMHKGCCHRPRQSGHG